MDSLERIPFGEYVKKIIFKYFIYFYTIMIAESRGQIYIFINLEINKSSGDRNVKKKKL